MADDLSSEVETRNRFEIDGNTFFGPFALLYMLACSPTRPYWSPYSAELITLELFGLAPTEAPLIHEVRQFLRLHVFDQLDGFFKTFFRGGGDVKI